MDQPGPMPLSCADCSAKMPETAAFCPGCGRPMTGAAEKASGRVGALPERIAGALAYLTFIPAIVFLLVEPFKSNRFARFHSIQCLLMWAAAAARCDCAQTRGAGFIRHSGSGSAVRGAGDGSGADGRGWRVACAGGESAAGRNVQTTAARRYRRVERRSAVGGSRTKIWIALRGVFWYVAATPPGPSFRCLTE